MSNAGINVAFSVTDSYADHLGVTLYSLLKNNVGHRFNIFVLSSDFSEASKIIIRGVAGSFSDVSVVFIKPEDDMFSNLPLTISHITKETYFRYSLASLLPGCDKVVYMDVDLLILGDIAEMWSVDITDYYVAGSSDSFIKNSAKDFYNNKKFTDYKQSIGLSDSDIYVNAGVILLNLKKIRANHKEADLFENTLQLQDTIKFQDQDIINITFRGHILLIDPVYNYTERDALDKIRSEHEVRVVHFNGPVKPWAVGYKAYEFTEYFANLYMQYDYDYKELVNSLQNKLKSKNIKYALFSYNTDNIGDEIQSLAARRFIPQVDYYVDRDNIDSTLFDVNDQVKIIMNGWYSHNPDSFPPKNTNIKPLLISMYVADHVKHKMDNTAVISFLNRNGPVGARNTDTDEYFKTIGVGSYFSGCLTLTLQKSPVVQKKDFILAVDLPSAVLEKLKKESKLPVIEAGAFITVSAMTREQRFSLAEMYLYMYQSARAVVTTRLHATLPCLALETPVLNIEKNGFESGRFAGLRELSHHMSEDEYLRGTKRYDINNPPKNPRKYIKLREELIKRCVEYTGYINDEGYLSKENIDPMTSVDTAQPIFKGLQSRYELDYVRKVLESKEDMANHNIPIVNDIKQLKDDADKYRTLYYGVIESRSWKMISKINRVRSLLRGK